MPLRKLISAAGFLAAMAWAGGAMSQDITDLPPSQGIGGAVTAGVDQHRPFWRGSGPRRRFVAATFEAGVAYVRPKMHLGYGRPHWLWFGAELASGLEASGSRLYSGLRFEHPNVDVRVGLRYESPISQHFLPPKEEYDREEIEIESTSLGRYISSELEIAGGIPAPGGSLIGVATGYAIMGVPDGQYVFERTLKTVVAPPWVWRARLGYLLHVGWLGSMKLGGAGEVIHVPGRDALILRAGPVLSVALTHHLEASAGIMFVAASPDSLGIVGADLGQLGVRYRWAMGDRWADFP